jgi:hypothetical protein
MKNNNDKKERKRKERESMRSGHERDIPHTVSRQSVLRI